VSNPNNILKNWKFSPSSTLKPITSGLINQTYLIEDGTPLGILQRLNTDIFSPLVHEDIEAITSHLSTRGIPTPRLIRTNKEQLWHQEPTGEVWRAMNFLGNRTIERLDSTIDASKAGELVGKFHGALNGFEWAFKSVRAGAHDTPAHMAKLTSVLREHPNHRLWQEVATLSDVILKGWDTWEGPTTLPTRVIHGDLKISNIRFLNQEALCLIDLDTLAYGSLDIDLGDAMRSWCNPIAENSAETTFDIDIFESAMTGYALGAKTHPPSKTEWESIISGTERICWELASRFAWDALAECYFGFDNSFGGRGEHNLLRAQGQACLAASVKAQRGPAERLMTKLWPQLS
jgi:Ser/Thr protein kinase RdoA (MazF antagonist)